MMKSILPKVSDCRVKWFRFWLNHPPNESQQPSSLSETSCPSDETDESLLFGDWEAKARVPSLPKFWKKLSSGIAATCKKARARIDTPSTRKTSSSPRARGVRTFSQSSDEGEDACAANFVVAPIGDFCTSFQDDEAPLLTYGRFHGRWDRPSESIISTKNFRIKAARPAPIVTSPVMNGRGNQNIVDTSTLTI